MCDVFTPRETSILHRKTLTLILLSFCVLASGCGVLGIKKQVRVTPLLAPLAEATGGQMVAEINRLASVSSIRGKVDIQFLDTSFAECGIAEKYRAADGSVVLQRPGKIFLRIQTPFIGQDIVQMTSDGERFRVAVLMGEEKHRRFVRGTNAANYPRMSADGAKNKCSDDGKNKAMNEQRAVSALSGLRPQHFTDALLIRPVQQSGTNFLYVASETFEDETDPRPRAKSASRVMHGYYLLEEISPAPDSTGRNRLVRRFWFDRFNTVRLSRMQTFDDGGHLATDVVFDDLKKFGTEGDYSLPARVVLTRPQDHYSLSVTYQVPDAVTLNKPYDDSLFVLENKSQLPEVDLDQLEATRKGQKP